MWNLGPATNQVEPGNDHLPGDGAQKRWLLAVDKVQWGRHSSHLQQANFATYVLPFLRIS